MKKGLLTTYTVIFSLFTSSVVAQNVGIGTTTPNPNAILDITVPNPTTVPQGLLLPRLDSTTKYGMTLGTTEAGLVVYDTDLNKVDTWNGTIWDSRNNSGGGSSDASFKNNSGVISNSPGNYATDDFVVGATSLNYDGTYSSRMFFDKSNSAFRAGDVGDNSWDAANVGYSSAAFGKATIASSEKSFAAGELSQATGYAAVAMGVSVIASGDNSTAFGDNSIAQGDASSTIGWRNTSSGDYSFSAGTNNTASGESSIAIGEFLNAEAYNCVAVGRYNVGGGDPLNRVATDPVFEVGIGTSNAVRGNAMTILKNGNVGVGVIDPMVSLDVNGGFAFHQIVTAATPLLVEVGNDAYYSIEGGGEITVEPGITIGQIIVIQVRSNGSSIRPGVNITGGYSEIRLAANETVSLIWDGSGQWIVLATTGFYQ